MSRLVVTTSISRKGNLGYALVDNRAAGLGKKEADFYVCSHCQAIIFVPKWKQDGGFCGKCFAPICGPCADLMLTQGCVPFIKQVEQAVEATYRRRQNARVLGI